MDKNVILAKKYGRAIYEIAAEQHCLEQTEEDLRLIAETRGKSKELRRDSYRLSEKKWKSQHVSGGVCQYTGSKKSDPSL